MRKITIPILVVSLLFTACSQKIELPQEIKDVYEGRTGHLLDFTLEKVKPVFQYEDYADFLSDVGLKYDRVLGLTDVYATLSTSSTIEDLNMKLDVDWCESYQFKDNSYMIGVYRNIPVIIIWDDEHLHFDHNISKQETIDVKGDIARSSIKLAYVGLYDNEKSVDNMLEKPVYLKALAIASKEIK